MKVVAIAVNNTDFIEMQYHTLKKHFKGDYEFIVFNDAKPFPDFSNFNDPTVRDAIQKTCESLNIQCISIPNDHHRFNLSAAARTADAHNFVLRYQIEHPDLYLLLDSDMFLISEFDPENYKKYACAVVLQERYNGAINYIWNGIYYFDMFKLKNVSLMNWDECDSCDVGGEMREWLKTAIYEQAFTGNHIYFIKHLWSCGWNEADIPDKYRVNKSLCDFLSNDVRNVDGKFYCEIYDNTFLHYRGGGNWRGEGKDTHRSLTSELRKVLLS